ncbi:MAG: UPF0280 family protein [Thermodesulfobacteria bacterium]|nr:UPF0280 family protein [Thermodesulfobacteriota bacterium]
MKFSTVLFYRTLVKASLCSFRVVYKETDLQVFAEKKLVSETLELIRRIRSPIEAYIASHPEFLTSLEPLKIQEGVNKVVRKMLEAGEVAGVGPMASVAGTIAEEVGFGLINQGLTKEVVVENGGDVFLALSKKAKVGIFAGDSPLSGKVAVVVGKELMPCGVCTSSGKVGHSLSFGNADAITVIHRSASIADALATAFGNLMKTPSDFKKVIAKAEKVKDIYGVVCIFEDKLMAWGKKIRLEPI